MPGELKIKDNGAWHIPKNIYVNQGGSWSDVRKVYRKEAGSWIMHWPVELPYMWSSMSVTNFNLIKSYGGWSNWTTAIIPQSDRNNYPAHVTGAELAYHFYFHDDDDFGSESLGHGVKLYYSNQLVDPELAPGNLTLGNLNYVGPVGNVFNIGNDDTTGWLYTDVPANHVIVGVRFRSYIYAPGDDDRLDRWYTGFQYYLITAPVLVDGQQTWSLNPHGTESVSTTSQYNEGDDPTGRLDKYATTELQQNWLVGPKDTIPADNVMTRFGIRYDNYSGYAGDDSDDDDLGGAGGTASRLYMRLFYDTGLFKPI